MVFPPFHPTHHHHRNCFSIFAFLPRWFSTCSKQRRTRVWLQSKFPQRAKRQQHRWSATEPGRHLGSFEPWQRSWRLRQLGRHKWSSSSPYLSDELKYRQAKINVSKESWDVIAEFSFPALWFGVVVRVFIEWDTRHYRYFVRTIYHFLHGEEWFWGNVLNESFGVLKGC